MGLSLQIPARRLPVNFVIVSGKANPCTEVSSLYVVINWHPEAKYGFICYNDIYYITVLLNCKVIVMQQFILAVIG